MRYSTEEYREGKRLHPLTLLYRGITSSPGLLIAIYLATVQGDKEELMYVIITFIILFITLPNIVLTYFYFTFYITPKELVIHSGVFSRKQRNIPLKKIQNVKIEQNILMRILGLSKVQMETAGDIKTEGNLEYVSKSDAEEIKNIIKEYQYQIDKEDDSVESDIITVRNDDNTDVVDNFIPDGNDKLLFVSTIKDTIYYGAMRLRPVVLAIAFWFLSVSFQFDFLPDISELGIERYINELLSMNPFIITLYFLGFIIALIIFTIIIDIILTINQYYGFKLTKEDNKLYTTFGLLTKRHGTIPLKKLQSLTIFTNPIKKKFDYYTLALQTAGFGEKGGNAEAAIPFGTFNKIMQVIQKIYNFEMPQELNPVSKLTIRRAFIRYNAGLIILMFISYFVLSYNIENYYNLLWFIIFIPLFWYSALLRYRFRGYAIIDDKIIIKQGFWFQKTTVIQIKKIQTLNIKETLFQRRLNLATLNIDTASTSVLSDASIVDLDRDEAKELMQLIADKFREINN